MSNENNFVAAGTGFSLVGVFKKPKTNDNEPSYISTPIVAWAIDKDKQFFTDNGMEFYMASPVVADNYSGDNIDVAIMLPSGRVIKPGAHEYRDLSEYICDVRASLKLGGKGN